MPAIKESEEFKKLVAFQLECSKGEGNAFNDIDTIKYMLSSWAVKQLTLCNDDDRRKMLAILYVARNCDADNEANEEIARRKFYILMNLLLNNMLFLRGDLDKRVEQALKKDLPEKLEPTPSGFFTTSDFTKLLINLYNLIRKNTPELQLAANNNEEKKQEVPEGVLRQHSVFAVNVNNPLLKTVEYEVLLDYCLKPHNIVHPITLAKALLAKITREKLKVAFPEKAKKLLYVASLLNKKYENRVRKRVSLTMAQVDKWINFITQDILKNLSDSKLDVIQELPKELPIIKTGIITTSDLSVAFKDLYKVVLDIQKQQELELGAAPAAAPAPV